MMKFTVLFCLIASTLAQQINVRNSDGFDNEFLDVSTCDDSTKDGRLITMLNSALTQWKIESRQEFCALQCTQDQCVDHLADEKVQNNGQFQPLESSQDFGRDQFQEGQLDQFQGSQQDGQFRPMVSGQSAQQGQVQGSQQDGQFRPMVSGQSAQQGQVQGSQQDGQFRPMVSGQSAQQGQVQGNQQDGQLRPMVSGQSAQQGQVQPMVRNKRQAININNSVISDSTFISVNVCKMPKFQDLLKPINKFISNMKKTDFKDLCRLHKTINICNCYVPTTTPYYAPTTTPYYAPTTTPYYYSTPTTTHKSYSKVY